MSTILFSNPPWWFNDTPTTLRQGIRAGSRWPFTRPAHYAPDAFKFGSYLPFPFFLASAAAYAERAVDGEHTVIMRDSIARGESVSTFYRYLLDLKPDMLVVETGAASWEHDLEMLRAIKFAFPSIRIAVGGPIAKTAYEEHVKTGNAPCVTAWFQGEYEQSAVNFIEGAEGLLGFNLLTREQMNNLPYPMFDEACAFNYWDACPEGQKAPHLQLLTSRGCPYRCCFCAWPATMTGNDPDGTKPRSVRFHSPEWVEGFIRHRMALAEAAGTPLKSIYLDDDTANLSDKHILGIAEVMKRIGLPWSAMCRADTIKRETWLAMKDAGCFGVKIGFESGSQRVVTEIVNKRLNIAEAKETCRWLVQEVGMTVHTTWTVGLPGETEAEREQTLEMIRSMYREGCHHTHQLSGTATIEGTPLDTLAKGEALKAYPGAVAGEQFQRNADGVAKLEGMTR